MPENSIFDWTPLGDTADLSPGFFNSTSFENAMNIGHTTTSLGGGLGTRTEFPTTDWPNQASYLQKTNLSLATLPPMVPLAIGATQRPLEEYLQADKLQDLYTKAYQLFFARQLRSGSSPSAKHEYTQRW